MTRMLERLYITTAIPYVNAPPHIGFALEAVQTDIIARWHRMRGSDVFFATGTDENSLKNVQAAQKEGIATRVLVDRNAGRFAELHDALALSNDVFIRTTEPRHIAGAQELWRRCSAAGAIYRKRYRGLYCVGCELFYQPGELIDGKCPEHQTVPEEVEEENYFFRLSTYADQLHELISTDKLHVTPESRKNEVLRFIERGLEDFSISRSVERSHGWGVPVPDDPSQVMYVWFDALMNYLTALDFPDGELYRTWWVKNPRRVHVIGKGILRFHAVYWPAMLLAGKMELPTELFVHGYLTVDGQKMSKSLGNVVDPFAVVEKYGTDTARFYLAYAIPATGDGDFSEQRLRELYQAKLANGIGNLLSRVLTLVEKHFDGRVPEHGESTAMLADAWKRYAEYLDRYALDEALRTVTDIVSHSDQIVDENKLWALVKTDKAKAGVILYYLLENLRAIAWMIQPFLPETSKRIFAQIDPEGRDAARFEKRENGGLKAVQAWGGLEPGAPVKKGEPLFPRLDQKNASS